MNLAVGRFITRDTFAGDYNSPLSLNRWMYVQGNPVMFTDPSGLYWWGAGQALFDASELRAQSQNIHIRIQAIWMAGRMKQVHAEYPGPSIIPVPNVDLLSSVTGEVWEIKPWDDGMKGAVDANLRVAALNVAQRRGLLKGMNPVAMPYNWNFDPISWNLGVSFPGEMYIGTDDSGWFDYYAGQIAPGLILWWKFPRETPKFVPLPLVLPNNVTWSDRNRRENWKPGGAPVPVPAYSNGSGYNLNLSENQQITLISLGIFSLIKILEYLTCGPAGLTLPPYVPVPVGP